MRKGKKEIASILLVRNEYLSATNLICLFKDKGTADVIVDGEKKRELTAGRGFGETSLLYNKKSTKTIVAKPHSGFWRINRKKYRESLSKQILTEYDIKLEFVQKADIFGKGFSIASQ